MCLKWWTRRWLDPRLSQKARLRPPINQRLYFLPESFLIALRVSFFDFSTMPSFDAHALTLLIALAMVAALVIRVGAVPVVRVVRVAYAPPRSGKKRVEA
jgi:hypothetical protein